MSEQDFTEEDIVFTETLGDLLYNQGLLEKAKKVYKVVYQVKPSSRLNSKIYEINKKLFCINKNIELDKKIDFLKILLNRVNENRKYL
jgi:hypothetical protein